MTADPPEATPRPRLSLVSPPARPERAGGGHGLPVATPAPARTVAAVPDPLQAHGGGHRAVSHPVPHPVAAAGPWPGAEASPFDDDDADAESGNTKPGDRAEAERHDDHGARLGYGAEAEQYDDAGGTPDGTGARPQDQSGTEPGDESRTEPDGEGGGDTPDGAAAERDGVPEPEDASCDDAVTPSAVPNPEETVRPAEPAEDREPEAAPPHEWHGIVLVTGTDTEVGKTIATAAMAAAAQAAGLRVAVIKPGQTGIATGAPTDADVVTRLAGPDTVRTLAEYPEPLAPLAAAKVAGLPPLELFDVVDAIRAEATKHDLVLVEGAGGLLVPMGLRPSGEAWTFADLATTLGCGTIVVSRAGLGTLNHTALTLEALNRRGVHAKVILGAWPVEPELVHWANLGELVPHLVGALPAGAGSMDPGVFRRSAPGWLTPALHGVLDNWRVWAEESG
jgi:dethiobiotin synthetase